MEYVLFYGILTMLVCSEVGDFVIRVMRERRKRPQ